MRSAAALVPVLFLFACTDADPAEPGDAEPWPCASQRGDVHTTYEYDEAHRVIHERATRGGERVREAWTDYQGAVEVRAEVVERDAEGIEETTVVERTIASGRVTRERLSSSSLVGYTEDFFYGVGGRVDRSEGTLDTGQRYERSFSYDGDTEAVTFHWVGSTLASLRMRYGNPWTREELEGGPFSRHDRWFDGNALVIREEKFDTFEGERLLFRREVTRRADGAPLTEVFEDADGRAETTYLFACGE